MFVTPILFASNMLVGRAVAGLIPPVALGFWRWTFATLMLLPFAARPLWLGRAALRREWRDLAILGALGVGVCGAVMYIGARTTTATNIGLIYAISPVLIILLARIAYGEAMSALQGFGVVLSLIGVIAIVARGDAAVLLGLQFTPGDLYIVVAAAAWAIYVVILQHRPSALAPTPRLTAIAAAGVLIMLPFTLGEAILYEAPRFDAMTVGSMFFLGLVPGIGAYQTYAYIQRRLGANRTALLMYLIPIYNAGLAWALLGERLEFFHLIGAALVLPGIWLATTRSNPSK